MESVVVIKRVELVELDPLDELGLRHALPKFFHCSSAKSEGKDMPKPILTLGG
jgi:hypothetical protein